MSFEKCAHHTVHPSSRYRTFLLPQQFLCAPFQPTSTPRGNRCSDFLSDTLVLHVLELHINGIIQYVLFWVWEFFLLNIMSIRFIHVITSIMSSSLFIVQWYFILWIYHNLFIHYPIYRSLICFQCLTIMHITLWTFLYTSLIEEKKKNEISKLIFKLVVSSEICESFICSTSLPTFGILQFFSFILAIIMDVQWYLIVV